jgi:large subunit ribosomal protein L22
MQIVATQKNVRQSPRKVRLVANSVKKLSLEQALKQLAVIERRASLVVLKTVKQAIANAMNNHQLSFDSLTLKSIEVVPGQTFKRFQPVSRGRAHSIMKRSSHIRVVLETKAVEAVAPVAAAPVETKVEEKKVAAPKKAVAKKPAAKKTTAKSSTSKGKTK